MAETVFPSKEIVKLSYEFVAVIASRDASHGEGDYIVKGQKEHLCALYDVPDCKSHQRMAQELARRGMLKGVTSTPTHILFDPNTMKEIARYHYLSAKQLEDAIEDAQKKLGKPVRWRDYEKVREALDTVRKHVESGDYRKAIRELRDFDAKGMKNIEAEAAALKKRILDEGHSRLDKARAAAKAGEIEKAKKMLVGIRRDFDHTGIEDEARKLLQELAGK